MSEKQSLYLVMVDPSANNNKYYRMIPQGSTFEVQYGRVGNPTYQTDHYDISMWDKKLNEKIKKGYVDQTRLVAEVVTSADSKKYKDIPMLSVAEIVDRLQKMASKAIEDNYTISSNKVTQKMIDEAQILLDKLVTADRLEYFNELLVELFRTIPRRMGKVADYLAYGKADYPAIFRREQDLLDVMRGQVVQKVVSELDSTDVSASKTILEALGLELLETEASENDIIRSCLGGLSNKFFNAWKVVNQKTQEKFDRYVVDNKINDIKMLWHGSRNENWWGIMNTGLLLRPNAPITGKMFGYGIYFAPSAQKSFGYTSYSGSYWAGGRSNVAFMSLFDVAYGKPFNAYSFEGRFSSLNYDGLRKISPDANCLHAHAGNMLRNDEIVVYQENQITIKYLVELR